MYKISLVQGNDEIGGNIILPLAIGMLWQAAKQDTTIRQRWKLEHIVYNKSAHIESTAKELSTSDVVAMSTYIWNIEFHMSLARTIKKYNPGCFILVGGPEISPNSAIWKEYPGCIDLAIMGEGDTSFTEFLLQWPGYNVTKIPGAWNTEYYSGAAPRVTSLEPLSSPYLDGFYDDIVKRELANGKYIQAVLQTNRGCPYHCTFCEEGKDYKNKMFFYDEDRIRAEIEWCGRNHVEYLSLADDNWGISARDVELMRFICETQIKHGYPRTLDATWAKNAPQRILEMAQIDRDFGTNLIRGITIALQSTNPTTLTAIKRFNLIDYKQIEFNKNLLDLQVPTYVEMIWPLPAETLDSFLQGIDSIVDANTANWLAIYPLKINQSSDLYDDYANDYLYPTQDPTQIINDDFNPSSTSRSIPYASKWVSHEEVVQGHVIMGWVSAMHYFGFAHPILDWLRKTRRYTTTETILKFKNFIKTRNCATNDTDLAYSKYWSSWLQKKSVVEISIFPREQTKFWYPWTHLASRFQNDKADLYQCFYEFLISIKVDRTTAEKLVYLSQNGVVDYNQTYPYQLRDGSTVAIEHSRPEFLNPAEFGQFYYWFKRKQGYSKISLAHSPEYLELFT
jgi:radical SAM superfamily enzyme YgiQ (UPF0313 family)